MWTKNFDWENRESLKNKNQYEVIMAWASCKVNIEYLVCLKLRNNIFFSINIDFVFKRETVFSFRNENQNGNKTKNIHIPTYSAFSAFKKSLLPCETE